MTYNRILMDFKDVKKRERVAELKYGGRFYEIAISVNPRTNKVLASLSVDRKKAIESNVCINNQTIMFGYAGLDMDIPIDFIFLSEKEGAIGNSVDFEDLGVSTHLYIVEVK